MLKALVLRKRIDDMKKNLEALRAKDAEFQKREDELTAAFGEVTEETSEEDKTSIESQMDDFDKEKSAHEEEKASLEKTISETESELKETEEKQEDRSEPTPASAPIVQTERGVAKTMRTRALNLMTIEQRTAFVAQDEVKGFLENVRSLARGAKIETRSITGKDLLIPEVILPLVRSEAEKASLLMKHVRYLRVRGTARQVVEGSIPEAVWTEAAGILNEMSLTFTQKEVDGYKLGGFIMIDNATLEDNDINLADEIFSVLGQALGYGVDKAIVYGTGTKMPTGFAATATKKSVSGKSDAALFKGIIEAVGDLKHESGELFWVCNFKTKMRLIAASLTINAAGAIVAGVNSTMPLIGGAIETEDFVPDGEVLGGFGQRYLLAERAGTAIAISTEYKFVEDQTVFKGTNRYDGKPVFTDSFMAIGLDGEPTAAIGTGHPFIADTANA